MHTRLLKVKIHRALLTCISMLCSQFNRCLLWVQHHWMYLKGTTGVYVQTTDQSFFKTAWETAAVCWQQHHWHLSYCTLLTQWHYFQNESYLTYSLLSANCLESPHNHQTPFSFPFFQKKLPKIPLLFLHNTKLVHCLYVYGSFPHWSLFFTVSSEVSISPLLVTKNLNCFVYPDKTSKWSGVMFFISL